MRFPDKLFQRLEKTLWINRFGQVCVHTHLQGKLNVGFYMLRFMFPKVIYTVLIAILLYKLLNSCNIFFKRFDRD